MLNKQNTFISLHTRTYTAYFRYNRDLRNNNLPAIFCNNNNFPKFTTHI